MTKQRLYILCGLPYSGKTTLTKKLIEKFGFEKTSVDEQIDKYNMDTDTMTQEDWNFFYTKAYDDLKEKLKNKKSVIFDLGHLKKSERNTARAIAQSFKVPYTLILLNVPQKELERRWVENEKTKYRGQLSKKGLKKAFDMWEEPTNIEDPVIYDNSIELEEWINKNILLF